MTDTKSTPKTSKAPKNRNRSDQKIRYLVKTNKGDGNFLIQVAASWKVTFGWVNPSSKGGGFNEGHCMRVWEGEKLRAVFDNVVAFRDMSIPLAKEIRKETGNSKWESDSEGSFEKTTKVDIQTDLLIEAAPDDVFDDEDF